MGPAWEAPSEAGQTLTGWGGSAANRDWGPGDTKWTRRPALTSASPQPPSPPGKGAPSSRPAWLGEWPAQHVVLIVGVLAPPVGSPSPTPWAADAPVHVPQPGPTGAATALPGQGANSQGHQATGSHGHSPPPTAGHSVHSLSVATSDHSGDHTMFSPSHGDSVLGAGPADESWEGVGHWRDRGRPTAVHWRVGLLSGQRAQWDMGLATCWGRGARVPRHSSARQALRHLHVGDSPGSALDPPPERVVGLLEGEQALSWGVSVKDPKSWEPLRGCGLSTPLGAQRSNPTWVWG